MGDDDRGDAATDPLAGLGLKLDTVAGALAAMAASHSDLVSHVAEAEARRSHDAHAVSERLEALEQHLRTLAAAPIPPPPGAPGWPNIAPVDLEPVRADLALSLDVLARVADSVERLDARTEDRLAAVRDAALAPVSDLQALLAARNERNDTQLAELAAAVQQLAEQGPEPVLARLSELADALHDLAARPAVDSRAIVLERVDEVAAAVKALTWRLPEISEEVAGVRERLDALDLMAPLAELTDALGGRLTLHTDTALAGVLRLIDDRLAALRDGLADTGGGGQANVGGFEAGAVMGAAQAAWNRLEQRLDHEFDDLGRQLQAMAGLLEQAVSSAEAAANRPVVTGDQLRKAATAVKDTVVGASRSRRDRRGGPRGLGSGT